MITEPIRDKRELMLFLNFYSRKKPNTRNHCLIVFGLNTALRISDILTLKWENIYDFNRKKFRKHVTVREQKTGKINAVPVNKELLVCMQKLFIENKPLKTDYIFSKSTNHTKPLSRSQAYRIVKYAALECHLTGNIGCHSLRKTFGFYAWKQGTPPALLMDIYNHSSYSITKRYLGITQVERDAIFMSIHFPG